MDGERRSARIPDDVQGPFSDLLSQVTHCQERGRRHVLVRRPGQTRRGGSVAREAQTHDPGAPRVKRPAQAEEAVRGVGHPVQQQDAGTGFLDGALPGPVPVSFEALRVRHAAAVEAVDQTSVPLLETVAHPPLELLEKAILQGEVLLERGHSGIDRKLLVELGGVPHLQLRP